MTRQELLLSEQRALRYRAIEIIRDEVREALQKITEPWKETGPHGQGPFTGNARESRQVKGVCFQFTPTRGGSPEVSLSVNGMHIEAWEVGKAFESLLRTKLDALNKQLDEV